ncbi:hypothetical protein BDB00DRAFT_812740 [Zychaea mexicana]|uniref:uncharacterized protein n=1 Tax=Zychaea mexicana TaxID=64656 RepID=UPI0022FDCF8D|nr:uncharacterized protein BDB00DRAFT_812740 [Zychaea mexicana]KAI9495641.1 hypothetical protein BDB00DRAFT_812740 [Zychaea mexicana]
MSLCTGPFILQRNQGKHHLVWVGDLVRVYVYMGMVCLLCDTVIYFATSNLQSLLV